MFIASSKQYEQTQTYSISCNINNMHTTKTHYPSNTKLQVQTHKVLKNNTINTVYKQNDISHFACKQFQALFFLQFYGFNSILSVRSTGLSNMIQVQTLLLQTKFLQFSMNTALLDTFPSLKFCHLKATVAPLVMRH
jgi:hypothetical protein